MATFLAINEINTTEGDKMGPRAHVQIMFALKDKKCRVFKDIFLGCRRKTIKESQTLCDITRCIEK